MIKFELIERATALISKKLSPAIVYMREYSDRLEFICLPNNKDFSGIVFQTCEEVSQILDTSVEITDIREYDTYDMVEIVTKSEPIYSKDSLLVKIFTAAVLSNFHTLLAEKQNMLDRKKEFGSYYIQ